MQTEDSSLCACIQELQNNFSLMARRVAGKSNKDNGCLGVKQSRNIMLLEGSESIIECQSSIAMDADGD